MYTTARSRFSRWNRLSLAMCGGRLAMLVALAVFSPPSKANASETLDPSPTMMPVVPEPATLVFFGAAAAALFRRRWAQALR